MKKIYLVTSFVVLMLAGFLGVTYSYEYNGDSLIKFELIGDYEINLNKGESYVEYGVKVYNDGEDISDLVYIDSSLLNVNRAGSYKVRYEVSVDGIKEYVNRIVNVIDNSKPLIKLLGEETVYLKLGDVYEDAGYEIIDNVKCDIIVTTNLDINNVGEYTVNYIVVDEFGNKNLVIRKIIVN